VRPLSFVGSGFWGKQSDMPLFAPPSIEGMRILADGRDGLEGRGLLLISALHLAARNLQGVEIRVLGGQDVVIEVAIEALRWDTGLSIGLVPPDADLRAELAGARLFVAVAARKTDHLPLAEVAAAGVSSLVPVQFPPAGAGASALALMRAAHDPRELARQILDRLESS